MIVPLPLFKLSVLNSILIQVIAEFASSLKLLIYSMFDQNQLTTIIDR